MFAAIPFPRDRSRSPIESAPFSKPPIVSLFGQRSAGAPTTAPDCMVPPPNSNTAQQLGDSVETPQEDRQPVETSDLSLRKLKLTVETLEKQSYLLSLQIWHYECQYGLPHSEFSRQFDFGGASPIPTSRGQDGQGAADKETDPGEGTSLMKTEPTTEDDIVVKKEELIDDSDEAIEEEGQWIEDQHLNQEKSTEASTAQDTSFGNLFGPAPTTGINFAQPSSNIFGGIVQTNVQSPATAANFRLPQVTATEKTSTEETSQLSHRQLQLTVETMQKQSHLLSLQIMQCEFRHRIPHSEYSRAVALQATMNGGLQKEGVAAGDGMEPIDYTVGGDN